MLKALSLVDGSNHQTSDGSLGLRSKEKINLLRSRESDGTIVRMASERKQVTGSMPLKEASPPLSHALSLCFPTLYSVCPLLHALPNYRSTITGPSGVAQNLRSRETKRCSSKSFSQIFVMRYMNTLCLSF